MKIIEKLVIGFIIAALIIFLALYSIYESNLVGETQNVSDIMSNIIIILLNK